MKYGLVVDGGASAGRQTGLADTQPHFDTAAIGELRQTHTNKQNKE
jgi:hypothetical protein